MDTNLHRRWIASELQNILAVMPGVSWRDMTPRDLRAAIANYEPHGELWDEEHESQRQFFANMDEADLSAVRALLLEMDR